MKTKKIVTNIPVEDWEQIKRVAEAVQTPMGSLVAVMLQDYKNILMKEPKEATAA
jgi:hypothetical protein